LRVSCLLWCLLSASVAPALGSRLFPYTTLFRSRARGVAGRKRDESGLVPDGRAGHERRSAEPCAAGIKTGRSRGPARGGARPHEIGRAHVLTPVTLEYRMPSSA